MGRARRLRRVFVVAVLIAWRSASPLHAQDVDGSPDPAPPIDPSPSGIVQQASSVAASFQLDQVVKQPQGPPPTPRHTGLRPFLRDLAGDVTHLPSKENLFWAGVVGPPVR